MSEREHSPRPMGFVSAISDTNLQDDEAAEHHDKHKGHNPLHNAVHYLKNAVTLEPKHDEERRESAITEHEHRNDHGGNAAERHFWERHQKHDGKTSCHEQHEHNSTCKQYGTPEDNAIVHKEHGNEHVDKTTEHHFWNLHHKQHHGKAPEHEQPAHHHDGATDDAVGHVMAHDDRNLKTGGPVMGTLL